MVEDDTGNEEYNMARDKVRGCNNKLYDLSQQLWKEAVEGRLGGKEKGTTSRSKQEASTSARPECVREYEESGDQIRTPNKGEEEDISVRRRRTCGEVVNDNMNFSTFQWKVELRFPNRDAFKKAIAKFVVTNGRNLSFIVSNKNR